MILEYGAKNYFSFKEWVTISFKLGQQCPVDITQGDDFTKIIGVKGANASGKTNVLKILNFLSKFCISSFNEKPEELIGIQSFFSNKKHTEFYVEFKCNDILYKYELELTENKIYRETIYKRVKREVKILERIKNKLVLCNAKYKKLNIITLRDNASIISTAHQYGNKELYDIHTFFSHIYTNVNFFGLTDSIQDESLVSKFLIENKNYFDFVKKLIIKYDPDISDIEIKTREIETGTRYYPIFTYDVDAVHNFLTFHIQSSGTKALYKYLSRYKDALDTGGLLVFDEFDINLHPDILPDLLSLFSNKEINKKGAQIIFTTHNTSILDFLGKYRVYLVNKEHCESYAYRLDEIPGDILRNDRDISPIYRSGKIGGIPKL